MFRLNSSHGDVEMHKQNLTFIREIEKEENALIPVLPVSYTHLITGESASGKTVFVDNTIKACIKDKKEGIYTVIRCDDYYKDTSKELKEAGSYEELFKTGFSFDTPAAIDLELMKKHLMDLKRGREIKSPLYNFVTLSLIHI